MSKSRNDNKPTPPKKPLSSYFIFAQEIREDEKKKNPNLAPKDLTIGIAEKYRNLGDKEKKMYEEKAKALREQYEKSMAEYVR